MVADVKGILYLSEIAEMAQGSFHAGSLDNDVEIKAITTDSRVKADSSVFIALVGEKFDGHDYVGKAFENGAVCAVVDHIPQNADGTYIVVEDTKKALGIIAKAYKNKLSPLTVAVTGSVGKTTTKEFIYAVLSEKYSVLKTEGNFNNDIGLPMTLLGLSPENDAAVLEMGMSHFGEIEYLSKIAAPNIAVITMIGRSHIENLGSREGIRDAKLEIRKGLQHDGVLILNGDEPLLEDINGAIYVAENNKFADYVIDNVIEGENGCAFDLSYNGERVESLTIPAVGRHNVMNAAFAFAVGVTAGMGEFEIRRGLMNFRNTGLRQNIYDLNGKTIIADCYNASPESMKASVKVLTDVARRKNARTVAVLGDMKELGNYSAEAHIEVGRVVADSKVDMLFTFGMLASDIAGAASECGVKNIFIFEENEYKEIAAAIKENTLDGDVILFKASRAMALEKVIELLK
ncbi:MAG: UDP-N-acetylmuramoyl-tripeptide--D-alanyl-D-alanine ligase [Ruminococcaceae bacterium]|nr:UDP-N-acetylmuramoyl-tripeptide--D-alanyl-D-alanine ligase [Oscillospiraceae bacterium]